MSSLVLVDKALVGYDRILSALKEGVKAVLFDSREDTLSVVLDKISLVASSSEQFPTVGLIQHGTDLIDTYTIVLDQTPALVTEANIIDPSLNSWNEIIGFVNELKVRYNTSVFDFISCLLWKNPSFAWIMERLEERLAINFRASSDMTGNLANGGNWTQESDNVNIQDVYFTDKIKEFTDLLFIKFYRSATTASYNSSKGYKVITWGHSSSSTGSDNSALTSGVVSIASTVNDGFAAIKQDGSVVTWGRQSAGGDSSSVATQLSGGVVTVVGNYGAFAAIKSDGSVVTWGDQSAGGDSSSVATQLSGGVVTVVGNDRAFAAIKSDGSVVTWGDESLGGNSSSVATQLAGGVVSIATNFFAFAAIKSNGSVVTWGNVSYGGNSSSVSSLLADGVVSIVGNYRAFAALKSNGSVVTWGNQSTGGNSSSVSSLLAGGVVSVVANPYAFAAIKTDGSVVTWGTVSYGGNSSVATQLAGGVVSIVWNDAAFAAIKSDGSVVTWGNESYGGNSSGVPNLSNVSSIVPNNRAYAAIRNDGKVVVWGSPSYGGQVSSQIATALESNVVRVASTYQAFAAIKADGSVVTWGEYEYDSTSIWAYNAGGDSSSVASELLSGIVSIVSSNNRFAALKEVSGPPTTPTELSTFIDSQSVSTNEQKVSLVTSIRSTLKNSSEITPIKIEAKAAYINAMRTKVGNSITIPSTDFSAFIETADSVVPNLTPKPVIAVFPSFDDQQSAIIDLATIDATNSYLHIEVPIGYTLILKNGASQVTLQFIGDYYVDIWADIYTEYRPGDSITVGSKVFQLVALGSLMGGVSSQSEPGVVCFLGNAPVLTPSGYRRIDSLAVGDMVRTADGRDVAIQRVKHQRVVAPSAAVNPYVIPKGTLGATENLAISPRHAVAVPGRGMVEARELGLRQLSMKAAFDYYNLELPEWDNMIVAGVEVESLAPKKRVVMTAAQFREMVAGKGVDLARLARIASVRADGSVDVMMVRKSRRM